ncbi:MAG: Beta-galactosidase C-terminal domain [Clostridia bacterium]|nr:Beta-galactosidase C-terminal domain [Clostridia bacterium]
MKKDYSNEFGIRFKIRYDELKWLYYELYHDDKQGFDYLCKLIKQYYTERDEALKKRDREREQDTYWYRGNDIVGMTLYVDNFADNLEGVIKNIDYFTESGVNYIHLMPLLDSPEVNSDGGYAVSDFRKIQPKLGTMEDLQKLTALCHERGINCCLDFVMNHTSDEHAWAKAARQGDPNARSRYFFFDSWDTPHEYERTVPQVFPTTAPGNFTQLESGEIVMTTFYPYQWDLNYANPMVFNDMAANMLFLANAGIDVIRLDAVPYIWKKLGTNCRNLPQVHNIVRMMRIICEIVCPSVLLLGEVVMEPSMVAPYFGTEEKPECHILYNVTTMASIWNTYATRDVRLLRKQIDKVSKLPPNCVFLNYLRCHDDIGWGLDYDFLRSLGMEEIPHKRFLNDYFTGRFYGSAARGELYNEDQISQDARLCGTAASLCGIEAALWEKDDKALSVAIDADIMLHAFMFSLSGIPVIYSGDEVGQLNDYTYHDDTNKKFDSRYLHRGKFDHKLANRRHDPDSYQGRIFNTLKKLGEARGKNRAFKQWAKISTFDTGSDNVLGFFRTYKEQNLLALFNFCNEERTVEFDMNLSYTDLLTGTKHTKQQITLGSYGFVWALTE